MCGDYMQDSTLGENIKVYRARLHMTAEYLAEMVNISTVHMSRLENNKELPSFNTFLK